MTNDLGLRMVTVLPFIHQLERMARKVSDVSVADWQHHHTRKVIVFFRVCCYGFFQGCKSLYKITVYMIKINLYVKKKHSTR